MKNISFETKLIIGMIVGSVLLLVGAIFFFSLQEQQESNPTTYSRDELITPDAQKKGNASASAYLVEFSDFQCPACKAFQPFVEQIIQDHTNNLTFVYRHFPLPQHPYSEKAAIAAEAAGKQGKFWEMGSELFADQEKLSDETVNNMAKKLGLNEDSFKQALQDQSIKTKIQNDIQAGNRFGVNATPTFYLNGKKLTLRTPQDLVNAVNEATK